MRVLKFQSAMEYLMTYGWALLVIAIALVAMFQLGIFNGSSLSPHSTAGACQVVKSVEGSNLEGLCNNGLPKFVAQLNGQNGFIQPSPYPSAYSPMTISVWVDPASLSQSSYGGGVGGTIIDENENGASNGWILGVRNTNKIWFWPSANNDKFSTSSIPIGTWTNIIVVYNGIAVQFYINGVLDSTQSMSTPQQGAAFFKIGAKSWITGYWDGSIANLQIYNTSLGSNAISSLYLEGIGGIPINPPYLVGWWPLNGNAQDYSGNNNNGLPTDISYNSSWSTEYSYP